MSRVFVVAHNEVPSNVDCYAYIVEKNFDHTRIDKNIHQACPQLAALLKQKKFTGSSQETVAIPFLYNEKPVYFIAVGIGTLNDKGGISVIERYRRAVGNVIKTVQACNGESVVLYVSSPDPEKISLAYLAEQVTIIAQMAQYHFDDFITEKSRKKKPVDVGLVVAENDQHSVKHCVEQGTIIARAVNQARHWIDTPPSRLTPQDLVKKAQEIVHRNDLSLTVFHEPDVIKMGMGGLAAVSRGSEIDCALIIAEYKSKNPNAPTLCFVGKGITFDSGGLSLKPAEFMETMKEDMSGAAAVLCAIDALAQLDCPVNVVAIAPTSENLPSGTATKPGDIVTFYNGKTAEIKNTDAEGRLILADALAYAVKHYKPDVIIDAATLTGACSRALGPFYTGLFTQHEDVKQRLYEAAHVSGDKVWQLPMDDDYKKAIVSTVADICNIGNSKISAGASTAAHFLQHFVDDVPWAHLDIAGTAFDVPNISYYGPGGTGAGIRLLIAFAMQYNK